MQMAQNEGEKCTTQNYKYNLFLKKEKIINKSSRIQFFTSKFNNLQFT